MKSGAWKTVAAIATACMLAIAAVACFMGPCTGLIERADGGDPVNMKCHWSFVAVTVMGIVGAIIGVLALIANTLEGRRLTAAALAVTFIGLIVVLSPVGIGTCAASAMACVTHSHIIFGIAAVGTIISLVMLAMADPAKADLPKMGL